MKAIMIQGTGSDVGKSLIAAGLCRALLRRGLSVRPFKPQNMSNNAAVTADGGEIGRAQALQARACGLLPTTDMNPVLLKPESERGAQLVVQGRVVGAVAAGGYQALKGGLMGAVLESFARLARAADIVIVEGAGAAAEINLRAGDIANMGFALAAGVPVVVLGDIDRGGVIAGLVGTHALLPSEERALVAGFAVNKFRGDPALFDGGRAEIASRTGWRDFGLVPWLGEAARLPAEDAFALGGGRSGRGRPGRIRIAVPVFSRIANFDDFDPLAQEEGVDLVMVPAGRPLPGDADLVILPGSKSTLGDLAFLRAQGWDIDLAAHWRRGGRILGICGGYQMLGRLIRDPDGVDGPPGEEAGLGLLDVETEMAGGKALVAVRGQDRMHGEAVAGYEMHIGRTMGPDARARPLLRFEDDRADGACSADGRVMGCYVHGLFAADAFRHAFLAALGGSGSALAYEAGVEAALDHVAAALERHLDIDGLLAAARAPRLPDFS